MKVFVRVLIALLLGGVALYSWKTQDVFAQANEFGETCSYQEQTCFSGASSDYNNCMQNCSDAPNIGTCNNQCKTQRTQEQNSCNTNLQACTNERTNECLSDCQGQCEASGQSVQASSYSDQLATCSCSCTNNTSSTSSCGATTSYQCPNNQGPSCTSDGWVCESPILLDVDGSGFHMTSAANGVVVRLDPQGDTQRMGWTAPGSTNAWLALDRNYNGKIDDLSELFGNFTAQPNKTNGNGFEALRVFDQPENGGNGDGVIDENDAVFSRLLLWTDKNHDGISQPDELTPLSSSPIRRISLDYKAVDKLDQYGNAFHLRGNVFDEKGQQSGRFAWDVYPNLEK